MFDIRIAAPEDAQGIADVLTGPGGPPTRYLNLDELLPLVGKMIEECSKCENTDLFVARSPEGKVLGYMNLHWHPYIFAAGPEGYLAELFVLSEHRGQGGGAAG